MHCCSPSTCFDVVRVIRQLNPVKLGDFGQFSTMILYPSQVMNVEHICLFTRSSFARTYMKAGFLRFR